MPYLNCEYSDREKRRTIQIIIKYTLNIIWLSQTKVLGLLKWWPHLQTFNKSLLQKVNEVSWVKIGPFVLLIITKLVSS